MKITLLSVPLLDFVNGRLEPISMDAKRITSPYGIYLLSNVLRRVGHQVSVIDLISKGSNASSIYMDAACDSDLIGIGATTFSWPAARECIDEIRAARLNVPIVLGGIHPTMFDKYILRTTAADYVIRGEGEIALPELCEVLNGSRDINTVTGLTYRDSENGIVRNPVKRIVDLSEQAPLDYSDFPDGVYSGIPVETSRGCPFDCAFCSTSYRGTYRFLSADDAVKRIEQAIPWLSRTTHGSVHIIDDEFSMNTARGKKICKLLIEKELTPQLVFDSRAVDLCDESFVKAMLPFVGRFLVGAECGYDEGLKKIGKGTTAKTIEQAACVLHRHGVAHKGDFSFIIGFPWESYDHVKATIDFTANLIIKYGVNILLQWYLQIPGSRLWEEQKDRGVLSEEFYDEYGLFGNPYLFRTGNKLTLKEIDDISDTVTSLRMLHYMSQLGTGNTIEYSHPFPILRYFTRSKTDQNSSGLSSLRELSHTVKNTHQ